MASFFHPNTRWVMWAYEGRPALHLQHHLWQYCSQIFFKYLPQFCKRSIGRSSYISIIFFVFLQGWCENTGTEIRSLPSTDLGNSFSISLTLKLCLHSVVYMHMRNLCEICFLYFLCSLEYLEIHLIPSLICQEYLTEFTVHFFCICYLYRIIFILICYFCLTLSFSPLFLPCIFFRTYFIFNVTRTFCSCNT